MMADCKTCRFLGPVSDFERAPPTNHQCRRFPPVAVPDKDYSNAVKFRWPIVDVAKGHWCGEYAIRDQEPKP
jgi:hypothetical protein